MIVIEIEMHAETMARATRSVRSKARFDTLHQMRFTINVLRSALAFTALAPLAALGLFCGGCAARPASPLTDAPMPIATVASSSAAARAQEDGGALVALVDGNAIGFDQLRTALIESSGQAILRDAVLDVRLNARLRAARIEITEELIEAERALLLKTLSQDGARALELLGEIRTRQGLKTQRFPALLRRNAGLRALVAPAITLDEEGMQNAFDMLHGPKRVARLAVLASLSDAEKFILDASKGESNFADLAVARSLHESAARGGLLAPVARRDPSYPESLRAAIFNASINRIGAPVFDSGRFYLVQPIEELPADGVTLAAAREECRAMLRLSRERLLMDALARELSSLEGVTIFDGAFDAAADSTRTRE